MSVTFVHCTPEAERLIVKMARVSNQENEDNWDTGPRLLRYLLKHKHLSPFEMSSLCVRIDTERDIAAQIIRHRSFSFQELSTRYTQTDIAQVPEFRRQDTKNRQSSHDDFAQGDKVRFNSAAAIAIGKAYGVYESLLAQGVAKECARRVLPLCTPTTLYMHGTLRSWLTYFEVRCGPETQLEHRLVAQACKAIFTEQFPTIAEAAFAP